MNNFLELLKKLLKIRETFKFSIISFQLFKTKQVQAKYVQNEPIKGCSV